MFVAIVFLMVVCAHCSMLPAQHADAGRIISAWKAHTEHVTSYHVSWECQARIKSDKGWTFRYGLDGLISAEGPRVRLQMKNLIVDPQTQGFYVCPMTIVFNAQGRFSLTLPDNAEYPVGSVQNMKAARIIRSHVYSLPLRALLVPFDEHTGVFDQDEPFRLLGSMEESGTQWQILSTTEAANTSRTEVWLANDGTFRIKKLSSISPNGRRREFDLVYGPDDELTSFTATALDRDDQASEIHEFAIRKLDINRDFEPEVFTLDFPVGTYVYDVRRDDERYIVEEGDQIRRIDRSEYRSSYEALRNPPLPSSFRWRLLGAAMVALIACGALAAWHFSGRVRR